MLKELAPDVRWTLASAVFATAGVAAGFSFAAPVISLLLERMTGSGAFVGLFATAGAVTTVTLTPLVPWLLRRVGAGALALFGCLLGAACFPLYPLVPDTVAWFVIRYFQGLAFTLVFVVCETWINQVVSEEVRARVLSLYAMVLAGGLGLGAAASAVMVEVYGLDGWLPFAVGSAITLVGLGPLLFRRYRAMEPPTEDGARFRAQWRVMRGAPALMMTGLVFGAIEYSLFHLLPVFGVRSGFGEGSAALLLLALPLGNILLQYPIGMVADRFSRRRVLSTLFALCTLTPGLVALLSTNFAGLVVALALFAGFATGLYTLGLSLLSERHKSGSLAAANSAFIMMYGVGSLLAPPVIGRAMDILGPGGMPLVLSALSLLGLFAVGLGRARPRAASIG